MRSDRLKILTKLDDHELRQLLELFYDVRSDSDVAVDTDTAPIPEEVNTSTDTKPQGVKVRSPDR
jgi:hypothetical protein